MRGHRGQQGAENQPTHPGVAAAGAGQRRAGEAGGTNGGHGERKNQLADRMSSIETETPDAARSALAGAQRKGCLVGVYQAADDDAFSAGFVDALSDSHVRLRSVGAAGRPNGIEIRPLESVRRVETESAYLTRRLQPLMEHWGSRRIWSEQRLVGDRADLVVDALALSLEHRTVVTIWIGSKQYTGPVVKLADDAGTIVDLDNYGRPEGEFAFRIGDIDALDFGTEHERMAQFLMNAGGG